MFNVSVQISIHVYERKMVQCNTNFKSLALPNKLVKVFSLNIAVIITQKNVHTHTHSDILPLVCHVLSKHYTAVMNSLKTRSHKTSILLP